MKIEIWSDLICPWCYIGRRRLELALAQLGRREEIILRSFELGPGAQAQYPGTLNELLAHKYGVSIGQAEQMNARVTELAGRLGLEFRLDMARPGNSFDAHRLVHFAATRHQRDAAAEVIMHAYFTQSLPIGDRAALAELAPGFGLSEEEVLTMFASEAYSDVVRSDEQRAAQLGISAVPFFLFDGKVGISGAQEVDEFVRLLKDFTHQS